MKICITACSKVFSFLLVIILQDQNVLGTHTLETGNCNNLQVVVSDYSDPKTLIPCAYIITTKTMAQGVHKLGACWGMTQ